MLLQGNARLNSAKIMRYKIVEFLSHPTFSPSFAQFDLHLIRSLAIFLRGKKLSLKEMLKMQSNHSFLSKPL